MNKYALRSRRSYNKKAEHYDDTFDGRFTVKFKEILCKAVTVCPGDRVADIACGNGRFLYQLAERGDFLGYGIDISEKMIEQARQLNPDMDFYVGGCEALPFADRTIDVMTVCAAFHHFPAVERFAAEADRVMRSGGVLYIAEIYLPAVFRYLCNPFLRFSRAGDVRFYAPDEIVSLFEAYGFLPLRVEISHGVQMIALEKKESPGV